MRIKMPAVRIAQGNYWKFPLQFFIFTYSLIILKEFHIHSRFVIYSCSNK